MKRKTFKILLAAAVVPAALATVLAMRLTAIPIEPQSSSAPVATFATEAFKVDLPAGFKPYLITYALYWPDGRIVFEEMAVKWPLKSVTGQIWEVESRARPASAGGGEPETPAVTEPARYTDLTEIMGCPAALVSEAAASPDPDGPAVNRGLPLILEVQVGEGWLRFFEALATDARNWNPETEGTPERYEARREKFIGRVRNFLSHYTWTGPGEVFGGEQVEGLYRTRCGTVFKNGDEDFIFSIALARFIDDERRLGLNIDTRLGYYDWGGLQLCEADRLTRIADQINLTDSFLARTNCRQFPVGGRMGYEMVVSEGLGALKPGGSYLLDWQEDWTKTWIGSFLISFHLTSSSGGQSADSPEVVVGQWRAMLESVRFAEAPWSAEPAAAAVAENP